MSGAPVHGPQELLAAARQLLERPEAGTAGVWPRAAALLGRQALELLLAELWQRRAPGTEEASMRAQLICLPRYLDAALAGRVAYAWGALSDACHQHAYELAPTAPELRRWLHVVEELGDAGAGDEPTRPPVPASPRLS